MTTRPEPKAQPFSLSEVHLLDGPYANAHKIAVDYLLKVDSDRLLHSFRIHSGLKPKGEIYGGWENSGLAGHSLGHFLTACAQEYAATGDKRFKDKSDYIVSELAACQKSRPDGYLGAMPDGDRVWAEVKSGKIVSHGFDLNGLWSPWYTHHKVLAGLIDAYHLTGNKAALTVAEKFAGWAIDLTKGLTHEQWQSMLGCEYGGMNESLAELYAITKKPQYLELAKKFYDSRVLDPLAAGKDDLPGIHSNTQIPKIIGLARLYELTNDPKDEKTSKFFWETVVKHHSYAIGGNSNHEYFGPADQLSDQLSSNTCETCNTYNMLKLTRHLFEWEPKAEYADFYERAHLNHILASQDPDSGGVTYFMPLGTGTFRNYSSLFDDWTCCHGTGMENHTKHADSIYFHAGNGRLYVNLFEPSELKWHGQTIRQETKFPLDGAVQWTISGKAREYELAIRHPGWAKGALDVVVNGQVAAHSTQESSYMVVKRTWKEGDKISLALPLSLHTEAMPDNPKRVALLYGPLVLAADLASPDAEQPRTPVLVTGDAPVSDWLERVPGPELAFKSKAGIGHPQDLVFKPFYAVHHNRYAVYFDQFTVAQWDAAEEAYRAEEARLRDLEARTIDMARIGEMQPERDHNLKSEKNDVREANGRSFRTPMEDGWFELEMKADSAQPMDLVFTYWGNDRVHPAFDILVDGKVIAEDKLENRPSNKFFDVTYAVPAELTAGKSKIVVRVQAKNHKWGTPVAGLRTVRHAK